MKWSKSSHHFCNAITATKIAAIVGNVMALLDRSQCINCGLDFPHLPESQTEDDHDEFYPHWCGRCRSCCYCLDDDDEDYWSSSLEEGGMSLWHFALLAITFPVWGPALWIYSKYLERINSKR